MRNIFALLVIAVMSSLFFHPARVNSQDFEMQVVMNIDALPPEAKDRVKDMKLQIEDYFNKNKFADAEIYKIKTSIQLNFLSTNGFDNYDAQVFVLSQRIIDTRDKSTNPRYVTAFKYLDERWSFSYNRSMPFMKNEVRFDPFMSLLDFYAYMILGYDEDSFFPKGGNRYYQKALDICNKPINDKKGWTETGGGSKPSRLQLVQEMLNTRYDNFRQGYWEYHWMGIDSLVANPANAYNYMLTALDKISEIKKKEVRSYCVDIFFDEKFLELCENFLKYPDRGVYDRLSKIDPAHQSKFEDYKKKPR